jgi:hypothetical protein
VAIQSTESAEFLAPEQTISYEQIREEAGQLSVAAVIELPRLDEPSITDGMSPDKPGNSFFIPVLKWFEKQNREYPHFATVHVDEQGHHYSLHANTRQYLPGLDVSAE